MHVGREEREELNSLCKELFGVSSKWRTLLERGLTKVLTRTVIETVPGENGEPDTTREVEVPVLTASGGKQSYTQRLTVEEVKKMLLDLKAQRDAMIEERNKQIAEQKAKQEQEALAKKVQQEISGSAI